MDLKRAREWPHNGRFRTGAALAAGVVGAVALRRLMRARRRIDMAGRVAIVTGGSRGLGFAIASELARQGAKLVLCGRSSAALGWAREELEAGGAEVLAMPADVSSVDHVRALVRETIARFGRIDVLVNNAGVINVGPLALQTPLDFQEALDVMFWGPVNATRAVLPHMLKQGGGRIANITSIGGRISVPHLIPYGCAKFAAVGFSQGVHSELARRGVRVTTVVPGLMRTGSHVNAGFKGQHHAEYTWFALAAASPLTAISAERAARRVVRALRYGEAHVVLGLRARLAEAFAGLFPALTADLLAAVNGLLPDGHGSRGRRWIGRQSETALTRSILTAAGRRAGEKLHQFPDHHLREVLSGLEPADERREAKEGGAEGPTPDVESLSGP